MPLENNNGCIDINSTKQTYTSLEDNIKYIRNTFSYTDDLQIRETIHAKHKGVLIYLETMADAEIIERTFLVPLAMNRKRKDPTKLISNVELATSDDLNKAVKEIMNGACVYFQEDKLESFIFQSQINQSRSPEEPENEKIVRGSHQGFVEGLEANINLIRSRLRSPKLSVNYLQVGKESTTRGTNNYMVNKENKEKLSDI